MPETKLDLNKALQAARQYGKLDYSGIHVPNVSTIRDTTQRFETQRRAMGFKTEEEKKEELAQEMQAAQQRFNEQGLWNSEDVYDVYNAYQTDPKKQAEFAQKGAQTAGLLSTIPMTVFSAGTMGWVPALTSTATGFGGAYAGQKVGEAIDKRYGTNTTPWLSFAGGLAGGIGGYKGLVNLGSRGYLRGTGNMYGKQFMSDVVSDSLNKKIKLNPASVGLGQKSMKQLWNKNTDSYFSEGIDPDVVPDGLPESILPFSKLRQDYPNATLVPAEVLTNIWSLDGNHIVNKKNVAYDNLFCGTNHRILKVGGKRYYVGTDPTKSAKTNTLVHQGDLPMEGTSVIPIKGTTGLDKIWWEQNAPFYSKLETPKARTSAYVIDDVIPTEYSLEKTGGIFGSRYSVVSDAVNLADPKINFRFFRYEPISGEMVESPFVFPRKDRGSFKLRDAEWDMRVRDGKSTLEDISEY